MVKRILTGLLIVCSIFICGCSKADYEDILRLHVIGNSNSAFDQSVKLKVKDEVSTIMAEQGVKTYEEAIELALSNEELILETANAVLYENGADYEAAMEVGTYHFPEKTYGSLTFKEGNYNAVRLKLGEAKGENWWCVLFPPICFLDAGEGEFDLSSEENVQFKSLLAAILKE